jgi:AAA15 family ATPase/GTPase
MFRRDQIYFTEKDAKSGVTDLYSLDEFSVRKTENIEKGYLMGRYGAIPFLRAGEVL